MDEEKVASGYTTLLLVASNRGLCLPTGPAFEPCETGAFSRDEKRIWTLIQGKILLYAPPQDR
jgi:hypothetical protein